MKELFALFAQIALSRKGPQDLPASYLVLVLTVVGYWLLLYAVSSFAPPTAPWRLHLTVYIFFTLAWYAVLLRAVGKPERFVQTATATFGSWLLLGPPWVVAIHIWQSLPETHLLYGPLALVALAIAVMTIRAGSYVLKHALELPIAACVLLTLLQTFTGEMLLRAVSPPPILTT
ncbi:MAG: hypothetical protein WDO56_00555 [Gammaproteobacteria bacterium]